MRQTNILKKLQSRFTELAKQSHIQLSFPIILVLLEALCWHSKQGEWFFFFLPQIMGANSKNRFTLDEQPACLWLGYHQDIVNWKLKWGEEPMKV